jgi:hypothetical protein
LQLIKPYRARWASYEWALFEGIPLHENKIKEIKQDHNGLMTKIPMNTIKLETIASSLDTAIQYLTFLKYRTNRYETLSLNEIPVYFFKVTTSLSGTIGKRKIEKYNISYSWRGRSKYQRI